MVKVFKTLLGFVGLEEQRKGYNYRVMEQWNKLPEDVISVNSINSIQKHS